MFEKLKPFLAGLIAAALAVLGGRYLPPPAPPTPPPATKPQEPPPPTIPAPPPKPEPKPNPEQAIARIQFGNAGCSGAVIGPRREDGKWWVATAAHCVVGVGQRGTMRMLDGRTFGVQVAAHAPRVNGIGPDACWLVTDSNTEELPFGYLADTDPEPGTKVWHAGYGVDRPGNREEGEVLAKSDSNGQIQFYLSVSSGDSGGGICMDKDGKIVATVCCTTQRGAKGYVGGAGPAALRRAKPTAMVLDDWTPSEVPIREVPKVMPKPEGDK